MDNNKQILAITGASGKKSGGEFIRVVSENREKVNSMFPDGIRVIARKTSNIDCAKTLLPDAEYALGSLYDEEFLCSALKDVDTLVHIAGTSQSLKLAKIAAQCKVRRLILVHTTGIYSKYKEAGEGYRKVEEQVYKYCKKNNILLTICRPTMIYGNTYDNNVIQFIKMVDKLPIVPVVNNAKYDLQPVHYKDLANAYYNILINEEKTANNDYILSGGTCIQLRDMLLTIGKHLGKKVRFINCPFFIAYSVMCILYYVTLKKIDYREKVQRLCESRAFSFDKAAKDFGYSPIPFEVGIAEEIKQYNLSKEQI